MKSFIFVFLSLSFVFSALCFADDLDDAKAILRYQLPEEMNSALPYIERLANKNYSSAEAVMGVAYYQGFGVQKDYRKAISWLEKAASSGNTDAQETLALIHAENNGIALTPENKDAIMKFGFNYHKNEADNGKLAAIVVLSTLYSKGRGVTQNLKKSYELNKKAAERGHRIAQYRLGRAYKYGEGTLQDYERALYWFNEAAKQGSLDAMGSLSLFYTKDYGPVSNAERKAEWELKEGLNGGFSAPKGLMLVYMIGTGVVQDYTEAYAWGLVYKQKLTFEDDQLNGFLKTLRAELGGNGTVKAQQRAKELLSTIRENEARDFLR